MEESTKAILKRLSDDLSQINIDNFLTQIQNASLVTECLDISLKFCELINNTKSKAYLGLSEELESLKKNSGDYEVLNNILINEIQVLFNNLKSIISQNKTKIKNINSNINDIYTNLNLINSNIEKKKYSLATSRVEKILQTKTAILINIKQLDNNQQKFLDELKNDKFTKAKMSHSSSTIKVRPAPTPFPITSYFNANNNYNNNKDTIVVKKKILTVNNSNFNLKDSKTLFTSAKKKLINRRNRDFSLSIRDNSSRRTSINSSMNKSIKGYSTITNFYKKNNKEISSIFDNKKEIDELKRKLVSQKGINEKLKKEIEKLKINLKSQNNEETNYNNLKELSINMSNNISNFKDKINKTSDILFSLTFSFNSLQNKCNKLSTYNENEQEFSDTKKNY